MTATAVWPIHVALATVLKTLPMFVSLGGPRVFREGNVLRDYVNSAGVRVPLTPPWIAIGGTFEGDEERFIGQPGRDQLIWLKSWGVDREQAMAVHAEATTKLDGQKLTLTGHTMVRMKLNHFDDFKDQGAAADAAGPYVVIGRLKTETLQQ